MRVNLIVLLSIFTSMAGVSAQTRQTRNARAPNRPAAAVAPAVKPGSTSYQLGSQSVLIPTPDDMVEATGQSDVVSAFFNATESPENEVLAVHLPAKVLETIKQGNRPDFSAYTKVSVQRTLKSYDVTDNDFAGAVANFEKASSHFFDVNSPEMKGIEKSISDGLSDVSGQQVEFHLDQPVNMGAFQKSSNVYSVLLVVKAKGSKGAPLLCATSFVKINQRLLFVYSYREYKAATDVADVKDFTRRWTTQILAAN